MQQLGKHPDRRMWISSQVLAIWGLELEEAMAVAKVMLNVQSDYIFQGFKYGRRPFRGILRTLKDTYGVRSRHIRIPGLRANT